MSYIIYADIESLIREIDGCANNLTKSSTAKIGEHIPCGYLTSIVRGFDHIAENTLHITEIFVWKSFFLLQENIQKI